MAPMRAPLRVAMYRGATTAKKVEARDPAPVTADRPACPECGAGVRIVGATFSDVANGIKFGAPVYGSHAYGGGRAKHGVTCPGAGMRYDEPEIEQEETGMTTEQRQAIRQALEGAGAKRVSYTPAQDDGSYHEMWLHEDGTVVTLNWGPH